MIHACKARRRVSAGPVCWRAGPAANIIPAASIVSAPARRPSDSGLRASSNMLNQVFWQVLWQVFWQVLWQ
ncbi:MAG: hypothetical protein KDK91_13545, partial [Gammaproteobacteria bacterium]|nr:hypothetical protein [Gammaproteobacteria bacterium]